MPKAKQAKPETAQPRHTLHIRVEPSLAEWIARLARLDGRTINNWCERQLRAACHATMHDMNRREVRGPRAPKRPPGDS